MLSRFAIYFDEVARRGSIRRASEHLNVAPSAIDRQILKMEERLQVPLFDRHAHGMRLTAAGEVMIGLVRRWRREIRSAEAQIDELRGLRRGEVTLALAEGSSEFVTRALLTFRSLYPGIMFRLQIAPSQLIVDLVLRGEVEIGVTFNPPERQELRVERAFVSQIGAIVTPDHPLAGASEVTLAQCADYPLVGPDEAHSLRIVVDRAWAANLEGTPRFAASANSVELIKALVMGGMGVGLLTPVDIVAESEQGLLRFIPLKGSQIPLSVLSIVSASGRPLSPPAALLLRHLADETNAGPLG
jgi:DNA-binding transcriptional LysR family regulator